ncbi:MAG TPA: hypothetical protein VEI01_23170 [Terriglobales bacterium]|nr:hypothetical protein [Terriglobales bacterium]
MNLRNLAWFFAALLVGLALSGLPLASAQSSPAPPQEGQAPAPTAQAPATPAYQPKFPGDPARSDSEAAALGYMRVVVRAQKDYYKKHDKYASSLALLAGHGSFTKRMAETTDRGDYAVGFRSRKDGYILTLTPKNLDAEHRSFYADEDGVIHADETKAADENSPKIK